MDWLGAVGRDKLEFTCQYLDDLFGDTPVLSRF